MSFDPLNSWAVDAVTKQEFDGTDLDSALTQHLEGLTGKDQGWWAELEPDGCTVVERRFTQKRGMSYAPLTFAWSVRRNSDGTITVKPASHAAARFEDPTYVPDLA